MPIGRAGSLVTPQKVQKLLKEFRAPGKTTPTPDWVKKFGPLPTKRPPMMQPLKKTSMAAMADEVNNIKLARIKEALNPKQVQGLAHLVKKKPGVKTWIKKQVQQGGIKPFPGAKPMPIQ